MTDLSSNPSAKVEYCCFEDCDQTAEHGPYCKAHGESELAELIAAIDKQMSDEPGQVKAPYFMRPWAWRLLRARLAHETSKPRFVVLNGHQLKEALEFLAPDNTPEQLESEVTIEWGDAGHSGAGYYACETEYPEEGSILLGEQPEKTNDRSVVKADGADAYSTAGNDIGRNAGSKPARPSLSEKTGNEHAQE